MKIQKTFRTYMQAEIWAEIYGYTIVEACDLEDDLGIGVILEKFYIAPTLSCLRESQRASVVKSFETLWEQGYRPYEIYVCNSGPVEYLGETRQAGEINGWDIKHVFSTRANLKSYPCFDTVIGLSCMADVTETWHG